MSTASTKDWSQTKEIIIILAPIPSALLSFCASGTIIYMILRSPTKLNKPFRRIIFGMSVYDMVQSFPSVISALPSPAGSKWGAIGNRGTCATQGFLIQLAALGSPLYNLSLAFFYLCIIKFNMTNEQFQKRVENILHVISNFLPWSTAIYLLITENFNFTPVNCWIGPDPIDCIHNPDVECIRGENAYLFQWAFAGIPILLSLIANLTIMLIIIWSMISLKRRMSRLTDWRQSQTSNNESLGVRLSRRMSSIRASILRRPSTLETTELNSGNHGSLEFRRPTGSRRRNSRQRNMQDDMEKQALYYISANLLILVFPYIFRTIEQINGSPPFVVALLARITNPLQGFLNILIYTRIAVATYRASSGHSWIRSFWIVVQSGMDHDERARMTRNTVAGRYAFVNGTPRPNRRLQNSQNKPTPSTLRSPFNQKLKSLSSRRKGVQFQDDDLEISKNKSSTNKNSGDDGDGDDGNFSPSKHSIEQGLVYVDNVDDNDDILVDGDVLESNLSKTDDVQTKNSGEIDDDGVIQMCSSDNMILPIPLNSNERTDVARIDGNNPVLEAADDVECTLNRTESNENLHAHSNIEIDDGVIQMCSSDDIILPIPVNSNEARIERNDPEEAADDIKCTLHGTESDNNLHTHSNI